MSKAYTRPGWFAHIDGLRALAILAVMAFHAGIPGFSGGFVGVDIFFVMSGFLVATILSTDARPGAFLLRRAARLYPAIVVAAVGTWAIAAYGLQLSFDPWRELVPAMLYLTDYQIPFATDNQPTMWRHAWSVAVEAKFYVLCLLVLPRLWRSHHRHWYLLALWATATAWRLAVLGDMGWTHAYYRFDTRLSGLFMGLLVASWPKDRYSWQLRPWAWHVASVLAIALIGWYLYAAKWNHPVFLGPWLSAVELAGAILLLAGSRLAWLKKPLSLAPLVVVGQLSYGLYLWHYPLMRMPAPGNLDPTLQNIVAGVFALMLAWLSWRLIENPIRKRVSSALRS